MDNIKQMVPPSYSMPLPIAEPIASPFWPAWDEWAHSIQTNCVVCSPYITKEPVQRLTNILTRRKLAKTVSVHFITNLAAENFADGSSDLEALLWAASRFAKASFTYLPSVHAKVLIADDHTALVGSANFTTGGSHNNREYGVRLRDEVLVRRVADDINDYAKLGSKIALSDLEDLHPQVTALRKSLQSANKVRREVLGHVGKNGISRPSVPRLPRPADLSEDKAQTEYVVREQQVAAKLVGLRVKGKSPNAIFGEAILYLLARAANFAMTTQHLHTEIQAIHPDLCDNTLDLVINGKRYGKNWKHQVRNAQTTLKNQGCIVREGKNVWRLISPAQATKK